MKILSKNCFTTIQPIIIDLWVDTLNQLLQTIMYLIVVISKANDIIVIIWFLI